MNLIIDSKRREFRLNDGIRTGIFVRAKDSGGKFVNADIYDLTKESLNEWLRSRGGENEYAEAVVRILLDHKE